MPARKHIFVTLMVATFLASTALAQKQATSALIPREVLFGNPERANPQISPDGTQLGYLAPVDGVLNVWIRTLGKADDRAVTADKKRGIRTSPGNSTTGTFFTPRMSAATRTGGSTRLISLPSRLRT